MSVPSPLPPLTPPTALRPVRQAATLIVLRDGALGLEALLLRRADKANDQNSGASVFPGGLLDAHDRHLHGCCAGLDDAAASARLSVPAGGLDYYAAAVRECFEEAGILFAQDAQHRLVDLDQLAPGQLAAMRSAAAAGTDALLAMCSTKGWQLAMDRLAYFAHWLTPPGMPRRFDTRFFIAAVPPNQRVEVDRTEIAEHTWLRPADAIDPSRGLKLMNVTRRILQQLAQFESVDECMTHSRALRDIGLTMPRLANGPGGPRPVNMEEPAYAEVGFVDPDGRGHARHTLEGGLVLQLCATVLRVTSNAGGEPGAHSYFVGAGAEGPWALIDAHIGDLAHAQALRAAAPGPVRWILSTREHVVAKSVASTWRDAWPDAEFGAFEPGTELRLGEAMLRVLAAGRDASARSFLLLHEGSEGSEGMLFAGDAVLSPADLPPQANWLAPMHGFLRPTK